VDHERAPGSGQPNSYPADVSLTEVLADFEQAGFSQLFDVDDNTGSTSCAGCGHQTSAGEADVLDARRLEGASDPAEMASVLGLRCPNCGRRGTVVCRYGPEASAGEAALLQASRGATGR
jgi:hypothetical protein